MVIYDILSWFGKCLVFHWNVELCQKINSELTQEISDGTLFYKQTLVYFIKEKFYVTVSFPVNLV